VRGRGVDWRRSAFPGRFRDAIDGTELFDEELEHLEAAELDGWREKDPRKNEADLAELGSGRAEMYAGRGGTGGTSSMGVGVGAGEDRRLIVQLDRRDDGLASSSVLGSSRVGVARLPLRLKFNLSLRERGVEVGVVFSKSLFWSMVTSSSTSVVTFVTGTVGSGGLSVRMDCNSNGPGGTVVGHVPSTVFRRNTPGGLVSAKYTRR